MTEHRLLIGAVVLPRLPMTIASALQDDVRQCATLPLRYPSEHTQSDDRLTLFVTN